MVDAQYKQVKKSYRLTLIKMNQYCGLLRSKWTWIKVPVDRYLRSGVALKLLYALWFSYSLGSWPLFPLWDFLPLTFIGGYRALPRDLWLLDSLLIPTSARICYFNFLTLLCIGYMFPSHHTPLLYGPLLLVGALIYFLSGKWHIMMVEGGDYRRTMQASEKELATTKQTVE